MSENKGPIHVLHVDDDPDFVGTAATLLEREDERFAVETATSASEGLERLTDDVDCVVSDYNMPGATGIGFLNAVRERYPDLPFILYTGRGSEEIASDAISAGVTDYLQKRRGSDQYTVLANRIENAVDQYRSRGALEASQKRLSLFIEQSPLGVIKWDDDFDVVRVNDAAAEILGYAESELKGRSWKTIVPDSDRDAVDEVVSDLMEDKGGYHSVNENVRKGGERIICEWHNRVVTDENDEIVAIFSQFQDVTDRKERERTLQQLHEVSRELLSVDTKEEVAGIINEAVRDTLGYDNNAVRLVSDDGTELAIAAKTRGITEVLGQRPTYPVGTGTAGRAYAEQETLLYEDVQEIDDGYDRGDARAGMYIPIGEHGTLSINDQTVGAFDETDVQLAEIFAANAEVVLNSIEQTAELKQRNERLDEFVSFVSHDLRNPLNVAEGNLELAHDECDSERLDAVERAHERIRTLIDDLLRLAREGNSVEEMESVALTDAIESCWQTVDTADATLSLDTDRTVRADRNRLQQLMENLVRNAIEHGGADVTVAVGELDDGDGFYVADDGPGIPPDERETVFESGYSTSAVGNGFGLAIAKEIAEAHGWEISVRDSDEGGARFEITGITFVG